MKKDTRLDQIVQLCEKDGSVTIGMLARRMQVSEITIRRDLKLLESLKLVRKHKRAYAVADGKHVRDASSYHIDRALQEHAESKWKIGVKAASLVQRSETVIFDCGSTLLYMAQALPEHTPIRAVCYGLEIAKALQEKRLPQLIVLGGVYHEEMDMFESFSDMEEIKHVRAQKAFLSAFGVHKAGLTSGSFFASSIRKQIIASAEEIILLADSSKFGVLECAHFADLEAPRLYVTDSGISPEYRELLEKMNKTVLVV